jgi:hypothetical protein
MKKLVILLLLIATIPIFGQTGFVDLDTTKWVKIDTVEFQADFVFLVFYKDSTIQEIRVQKIMNGISTKTFYLVNNQLSSAHFVVDNPGGYKRIITATFSFLNGKMISKTIQIGSQQVNLESKTEEIEILAIFNEYFEKAKIHNSKI